jgi:hypothetical protein
LNNQNFQNECADILKDQLCEQMFCVEFDVDKLLINELNKFDGGLNPMNGED